MTFRVIYTDERSQRGLGRGVLPIMQMPVYKQCGAASRLIDDAPRAGILNALH